MGINVVPTESRVVVEIQGLDPDNIDDETKAKLRKAFLEHSVLLLRGIQLTPKSHVALTYAFGEPEIHPMAVARLEGYPEVIVPKPYGYMPSDDPERVIGQLTWHADQTFLETPPRGALLRAIEIPPEGGQTGFIDTVAVYDSISKPNQKRINDRQVIHRMSRGQRLLGIPENPDQASKTANQFPDMVQPLVITDPASGIKSLNVNPFFADEVLGMSKEEGTSLLDRLNEYATRDEFVYWHDWQEDDLVIWNNYRTLHSVKGYKQKYSRTMHRTTVKGEARFGHVLDAVA